MEARTFGWYVTQWYSLSSGDFLQSKSTAGLKDECRAQRQTDDLKALGVFDQVPTLDNAKPLVEGYMAWWKTVEEAWANYNRPNNPYMVVHWLLPQILQDPNTSTDILRYVVEACPKMWRPCAYNRACPEDLLRSMIDVSGTKSDPMRETKGGEIVCFILHNRFVSPLIVDLCARKTKRAKTQKSVVEHPNVSHDTLRYLSREGCSERIKKDALFALAKRFTTEMMAGSA